MDLKVFHEDEWREYPAKTYAEYTYEWLGEPHESASIKLDSSGHEVARNLNHFADTEPKQSTRAEGNWYWQQFTNAKVEVGKTYTFSIIVDKISDDDVPIRVDIGTSAVPNNYTRDVVQNAGNVVFGERQVITFTVTEQDVEGGREYLSFRIRNQQEATTVAYREVMLEESDTFGGYLDGDNPPSRSWANLAPRNISGIKRTWRQATPPPAGTSYEWVGERHASESIKRVGGMEVARAAQIVAPHLIKDGQSLRLEFQIPEDADTYQWSAELRSTEAREGYDEAGFNATFSGPEVNRGLAVRFPADGEWQEYSRSYTIDPEATTGHIGFIKSNLTSPWYEVRHLQVAFYADAGWPDRFDGDTESDRAHDLWYDRDGVPHEWVNGQGWVAS